MRKWALRGGLLAILLGLSGFWVLSGFSFGGTRVYDLNGANPQSERESQSWRYRVGQVILPLIYSHDTRYAPLYKEEVFRSVPMGASEADIRALLGEPLSKSRTSRGHELWHYSVAGPKTQDFQLRILEFGEDGRLQGRHAEFYVD